MDEHPPDTRRSAPENTSSHDDRGFIHNMLSLNDV